MVLKSHNFWYDEVRIAYVYINYIKAKIIFLPTVKKKNEIPIQYTILADGTPLITNAVHCHVVEQNHKISAQKC
jgi:hypothetical protein